MATSKEERAEELSAAKKLELDMKKNPEKYFTGPDGHIRDRIIINQTPDIPSEGVFVSLNGFAYLAKPGVEIDIPRPIRTMLDTRIKTDTIQVQNPDGSYRSTERDMPRITYILIKENVGKEEIPATE
ncbi:MAG TPA: hypothetical protein ACFYEK_06065 [Candidatus Wunengus sp. YC60]|jgi:hypothetical protein|uniref:hypothetical protein n=1 Tax=Candidatus Wunengus sp. YC60 TaxID=3367697 RepID=UPI0040280634